MLERNLDLIPAFKRQCKLLNILEDWITVLNTFKPLSQPNQKIDSMSEDLLSRTYPRPTRERDELPHWLAAYPAIRLELMEIFAPEVLVVIHCPSS
jgi:hypothetical protein